MAKWRFIKLSNNKLKKHNYLPAIYFSKHHWNIVKNGRGFRLFSSFEDKTHEQLVEIAEIMDNDTS